MAPPPNTAEQDACDASANSISKDLGTTGTATYSALGRAATCAGTLYLRENDGDTYPTNDACCVVCTPAGTGCLAPAAVAWRGYFKASTIVPTAVDCDDTTTGRHPTLAEIVDDGIDQDCVSGDTCYVDADNDGYRPDASATVVSVDTDCLDAGEGQKTDPTTDCDDLASNRNPGLTEITGDSVDGNCDGEEDCFRDADNDGFRPNAVAITASLDPDCTDAFEAIASDPTGDCDDNEALTNPGATEIPGDSVDETCDGAEVCFRDADNDGFRPGAVLTTPSADTDCADANEATDLDSTADCDDTTALRKPGVAEIAGDSLDQNCDGAETCFRDADDDGFRPNGTDTTPSLDTDCADANEAVTADPITDCDDTRATANPLATELCNGLDDNCNTTVDDGLTAPNNTLQAGQCAGSKRRCAGVGGFVDDYTSVAFYEATEASCDTRDNDCDGTVDDGVTLTFFQDSDSDGQGDAANTTAACTAPVGYVSNSTDCYDSSNTVFLGAPESIGDGVDQNCDGGDSCYRDFDQDGKGGTTVAVPTPKTMNCNAVAGFSSNKNDACDATFNVFAPRSWHLDCDGDGLQASSTAATACDQPTSGLSLPPACTNTDALLDAGAPYDCDDLAATVKPGAAEVVGDGVDQDCDFGDMCYQDSDNDNVGSNVEVELVGTSGSPALDCASAANAAAVNGDACDNNAATLVGTTYRKDCDNDTFYDAQAVSACTVPDARASFSPPPTVAECPNARITVVLAAPPSFDCNDLSAAVAPNKAEVAANGVDENCDGFELCFVDGDGDGDGSTTLTGTPSTAGLDCSAFSGFSATHIDSCDADPRFTAPATWKADCDGDGAYGATTATGCDELAAFPTCAPDVVVTSDPQPVDCDDTDKNSTGDNLWVADCDNDGKVGRDQVQACSGADAVAAFKAQFPYCTGTFNKYNVGVAPNVPAYECDDAHANVTTVPVAWLADCDGDTFYAEANQLACSSADAIARFAVARPTCDPATSFNVTLDTPAVTQFDCDDDVKAIGPSDTWIANCDADFAGLFGATQVQACDVTEAALKFDAANYPGGGSCAPGATYQISPVLPPIIDCDDLNASLSGVESWYGDCDGDGFDDPTPLKACGEAAAVDLFIASRPWCAGVDASVIGPTAPAGGDADCDDTDPIEQPGQVWYADCDADGMVGDTRTVSACDSGTATTAFNNFCAWQRSATPLSTPPAFFPFGLPSNHTVTTVAPANPDCWDGDARWVDGALWHADCDLDGTFGASTVTTCSGLAARQALCPAPPALVCAPALVTESKFQDVTPLPVLVPDCSDSECLVRPTSFSVAPGRDWNCDGTLTCFADGDKDGFGAGISKVVTGAPIGSVCTDTLGYANTDLDCDDAKAEINPNGVEIVADTIDQDCNLFDTCWKDADGDGFGRDADSDGVGDPDEVITNLVPKTLKCVDFPGVSARSDDCNDLDADEFPNQTWYADCDGDNFVTDTTFLACGQADAKLGTPCTAPDPAVLKVFHAGDPLLDLTRLDCLDDHEPTRFPGSKLTCNLQPSAVACEVCEISGDQLDDDCNGDVNTAGPSGALPAESPTGANVLIDAYTDADGDGFGDSSATGSVKVCEILPGLSSNSLDCDDDESSIKPGAYEICDSRDQNCNGTVDEAEAIDIANPDLAACLVLYRDKDLDGTGDATVSRCVCPEKRDPPTPYVHLPDGDPTPLDPIQPPSPLTGRFAGEIYVAPATDCDDAHADIHPDECHDGLDNDGDGFVDDVDAGCAVGVGLSVRSGSEANRPYIATTAPDEVIAVVEKIDGHDNECDGAIPVVELDCDDDASFPMLPKDPPAAGFTSATDLGLARCTDGDAVPAFECWGQSIELGCDEVTGLWVTRYGTSKDGFGGRYAGGYRVLTTTLGCERQGDCDDHCPTRCPGQDEVCDGVDNDCTLLVEPSDRTRSTLPDSLSTDAPAGTVVLAELDFDGDGHAACTEDFLDGDAQLHEARRTCAAFGEDMKVSDCDDLCFYENPDATEVCDGFVNVCDAPSSAWEGTDRDDDNFVDCGAYGPADKIVKEDIFVPVWVDCSGATPVPPSVQPACDRKLELQRLTAELSDSGAPTTPLISRSLTGTLGTLVPALLTAPPPPIVPLISPRPGAPDCDAPLRAALVSLADRAGVSAPAGWVDRATATNLVKRLCAPDAPTGGVCSSVQLSLLRDDEMVDEGAGGALDDACAAMPEQSTVRTVWPSGRVLEARDAVVEGECLRLFGLPCDDVVASTPRVELGAPPVIDALLDSRTDDSDTDAVAAPSLWWLELGRFAPHTSGGAVMTCWGDPRVEAVNARTGGDCDDGSGNANRDLPEGPNDLVLAYNGENGDCSRCVDGIDNNCDGLADCADPTCSVCFVGQGQGCSGGKDACGDAVATGGGCTNGPESQNLAILGLVPLLGLVSRRRGARTPAARVSPARRCARPRVGRAARPWGSAT
jgi:hypothetical protein